MCKLFRCSDYLMISFISLKYLCNLQQSRVTSMEELDTADRLTKELNKSNIFFLVCVSVIGHQVVYLPIG